MEINRTGIVESIQKKYGDEYRNFKWIGDGAAEAEAERKAILASISGSLSYGYNGTKPYYLDISPGCRHCGEGTWSCLFINGTCNGTCFFCPSEQNEQGEPVTNAMEFKTTSDYLDYIENFNIKGVSISGGEPLITIDKSIKFLSAVQERYKDKIHKWLYTNAILLTEEKLKKLKNAGLNEIRLNLYAQGYNIEKAVMAAEFIDTVTVEIPAIPEDYDQLCRMIKELHDNGIKYLNLHQLRCTSYNFKKFIERGYTFLHGQDATVLESELTALKAIKNAADSEIKLPINYCSFVYRNNFQRIRARQRSAPPMIKPYEELTGAGIIRSLSIKVSPDDAAAVIDSIKKNRLDESTVYYDPKSQKLFFTGHAIKYMAPGADVTIAYYDSMLCDAPSYRNMFKSIYLDSGKKITAERWRAVQDIELDYDEFMIFRNKYLTGSDTGMPAPKTEKWTKINLMEQPHEGLQSYW